MRRLWVCLAVLVVSILGIGVPEATGGAATSGWTLMSGPPPISGSTLNWEALSCVSSTFCMAIGPMKTLTPPIPVEPSEEWNGSTWSYASMPVPSVPAQLTAVSCVTSSFCMAVGYNATGIFADEWNGSAWSLTSVEPPSTGDAMLFSVDCLSATDCEAVGQTFPSTLAEQWDGTNWTIVGSDSPGANSNMLAGVSCIDPTDCWAVGDEDNLSLVEQFDGSTWSTVPAPGVGGGYLNSISCASATFCEAVGTDFLTGPQGGTASLIETWDGSTWTVVSSPVPAEPGQNSELFGVDCYGGSTCIAVGSGQTTSLVLDYQSGQWLVASSPPPPAGTTGVLLGAVSCVANWSCVVAGATGNNDVFAELPLSAPTAPSAVISSPNAGQVYSLNQSVPTTFSCLDGLGGPGIESCVDSQGSNGPGVLDTSTYGPHTYSVTATSADGQSETSTISYWVATAPSATIASPVLGDTYVMNQSSPSSFACSDGNGGPGIASCVDSNGSSSPGTLNTSIPGPNTYSVSATSADGLTTTTSVEYNVIGPPTVFLGLPFSGNYVSLGQSIGINFGCTDYPGGGGIASCVDSHGSTSPGVLDSSAVGPHTYSVTATSVDGLVTTKSYSYTVAAPPTATITSPASDGIYTVNQSVPTTFVCSEGLGGPGLAECRDSNNQTGPGHLNTSSTGTHTYFAEAESTDGLYSEASITYDVVDPVLVANETSGSAGQTVTFTVGGFANGETVDLAMNGATIGSCVADNSFGDCTASVVLPREPSGPTTVTATGGTTGLSATANFTVIGPTVTAISPNGGKSAAGTAVTITGTNFVSGATVLFGGTAASSVTVVSPTTITAKSPAGTGAVNVTVSTPQGFSAISPADVFTYFGAPTVTGVAPAAGPQAGGTPVTITGSNFYGAVTVYFGGVKATGVTVVNATTIEATSPAATGTVSVRVDTASGLSATSSADHFQYLAAPTVTKVAPASGTTKGGTTVTLSGTGFVAPAQVFFGSVAATKIVVYSGNRIGVVAPAGSAGKVDVTVRTPYGSSSTSSADLFTYQG
jgi:hypothetical protein